jgi:transcriptional regulator with XRE-family HTH domain
MGQARQTFERRQLGLALRRLRESAGQPQQVAADALGKVRSRVVALEDGTATATPEDLRTLLDCYRVTGAERETLLALAAHARKRTRRRTDGLPDSYHRFADLEASATEIDCYESGVVPDLVQSPAYVRATVAEGAGVWWPPSTSDGRDENRDQVAFRLERQERILGSSAGRVLRFVVGENALRADLGAPEVMRGQRAHLLALTDGRRDLQVRVLRDDVHGNPARGSSLLVLGFGDRGAPIAHTRSAFGPPVSQDDPDHTDAVRLAFRRVWELARSRTASRRLIEQIADHEQIADRE